MEAVIIALAAVFALVTMWYLQMILEEHSTEIAKLERRIRDLERRNQ